MNYAEMMKLFNSRKKGRDYKVFHGSHQRLTIDRDSGALVISVRCISWLLKPDTASYVKVIDDGTPLLKVTPDNVMELLSGPSSTDLSDRLMIEKVTNGRIWLRGKSFEHRLMLTFRYSSRDNDIGKDIPLAVGTKIDLNTKQPINKPDQVKLSTNRTTAQPVYQHVRQVGKVMDLLWRLGDFTKMAEDRKWGTADIDPATPVSLVEETLSTHAEQALRAGWNRGNVSTWDYRTQAARPQAVVAAEKYAKAREHGLKRLTEFLKPHHGAIVRTVVS